MLMTIFCQLGQGMPIGAAELLGQRRQNFFFVPLQQPRRGDGHRLLGCGCLGWFCFLRGHNRFLLWRIVLVVGATFKVVLRVFISWRSGPWRGQLAVAGAALLAVSFLRAVGQVADAQPRGRAARPAHQQHVGNRDRASPSRAGRLAGSSGCGGRACTRG